MLCFQINNLEKKWQSLIYIPPPSPIHSDLGGLICLCYCKVIILLSLFLYKTSKLFELTKQSKMLKEDWKYVRTPSPYILISISKMKRPRNTNSLMSESIEQTQKYHQNVFLKKRRKKKDKKIKQAVKKISTLK